MDPKTHINPYFYTPYEVLITMHPRNIPGIQEPRALITGWAYVISNQDPLWTQKPMHTPIFTHHMRS